jgi:molecular chaperone GrpE
VAESRGPRRPRTEEEEIRPGPDAGEGAPTESVPEDVESEIAQPVEDELDRTRAEAAEYRDHLQRLQAEFENYRKRVLREQTRAVDFATEPLVSRLLQVVDEFELALVAAEQRPDFDKFLHGVEIVYAKLLDILRAEGLERIEATGRPFDPTEHEALFQTEGGEGEPYVADVLRSGYRLKGRVIRPAGVKVARR